MTDNVHWNLALTIKDGREADFEALMKDLVQSTEGEEGALNYEWHRDGQDVRIYERYSDSDAVMTHLGNFGPFAERFTEIMSVDELSVYGPASPEVREAMSGFGAKFYDQVAGFDR